MTLLCAHHRPEEGADQSVSQSPLQVELPQRHVLLPAPVHLPKQERKKKQKKIKISNDEKSVGARTEGESRDRAVLKYSSIRGDRKAFAPQTL